MFNGKARMIPLEYEGRCEYSVVIVPDSVQDVVRLLQAPGEYIEDVEAAYPGHPEPSWKIQDKVTVIAVPFESLPKEQARKINSVRELDGVGVFGAEFSASAYTAALENTFGETGACLIEFSLDTSTIHVYTFPSISERLDPTPSFTGVVGTVTEVEHPTEGLGNVHFDLKGPHENQKALYIDQAQLAFDAIVNPDRLERILAGELTSKRYDSQTVRNGDPMGPFPPVVDSARKTLSASGRIVVSVHDLDAFPSDKRRNNTFVCTGIGVDLVGEVYVPMSMTITGYFHYH